MDSVRVVIIMAGGIGERFWPLSRRTRPKQLLRLVDPDVSLLEQACRRARDVVPAEDVYVVTSGFLLEGIRAAGLSIPAENIVAEPCKRNTAGCLSYAAALVMSRYDAAPEAITMAVVAADHLVPNPARFTAALTSAMEAAEAHDALVTIGIHPDRPATGFGYIEMPENAEPAGGTASGHPVYPVLQFREKPSREDAEEFLETGRFFWNSGMFFWRISTFLSEFDHTDARFADCARRMTAAMREKADDAVDRMFAELPDISIDYALMENARRVLVAPARFGWDDIGAWDALDRALSHDAKGNVAVGDPVLIDSENCIVYNEPGAEAVSVSVVGCEDLVVVSTGDAVLVVPKHRAQDVKAAVRALRDRGSSHL